jgi:hypothetical protein
LPEAEPRQRGGKIKKQSKKGSTSAQSPGGAKQIDAENAKKSKFGLFKQI